MQTITMFEIVILASIWELVICGSTSSDPDTISRKPRLIGGVPLTDGSYPYIVSIQYQELHFCGGTIINEDTILTAAHCIVNKWHGWMTVRSGSLNKYEGSLHRVIKMSYHSNYTFVFKENDIALLRIIPPITPVTNHTFVQLFDRVDEDLTNKSVFSLGWGRMEEDDYFSSSMYLRKVELRVISKDRCQNEYELVEKVRGKVNNNVCTFTPGKGNCMGDSGGPLMIDDRQVGIISWSFRCGIRPNVHTKVSAYLDWIQSEKIALSDPNRQPLIVHPLNLEDLEYFRKQGSTAKYAGAKFIVSIMDEHRTVVCSGSIIGYAVILTAAQCLDRKPVTVHSGSIYDKSGGLDHNIVKTKVHEDFEISNDGVAVHDIAVMRVDPPLIFNFGTRMVHFADIGKVLRPLERATVYGWGTRLGNHYAVETDGELQLQSALIMDWIECEGISSYRNKKLHEKQICTSSRNGMCMGDLGSPLIIENRLVGIFSWSDSQCADYRMPSVYTNVVAYADWIWKEEIKIKDELR